MKVIIVALLISLSFTTNATTLILSEKNTVVMDQQFTDSSVANVASQLLAKCVPGERLFLVLDTPGGSVGAGLQLIDFVRGLSCRVDTVTLFAASMGYITAQLLGNRYIIPSGILMSHKASLTIGGEFPGNLDSRLRLYRNMLFMVDLRVSMRLGISVREYRKLIENELWLTAGKAIGTNHADKAVLIRCGKSLSGTKTVMVRTIFGAAKVTKSKCPMITGVLDIKASNEKAKTAALKKLNSRTPVYEY